MPVLNIAGKINLNLLNYVLETAYVHSNSDGLVPTLKMLYYNQVFVARYV